MKKREWKASEVTVRDESFSISEEEHNEMKEYEEWCKINDIDCK